MGQCHQEVLAQLQVAALWKTVVDTIRGLGITDTIHYRGLSITVDDETPLSISLNDPKVNSIAGLTLAWLYFLTLWVQRKIEELDT